MLRYSAKIFLETFRKPPTYLEKTVKVVLVPLALLPAVKFCTTKRAVMLRGQKANRGFGITVAMHNKFSLVTTNLVFTGTSPIVSCEDDF